MSTSARTNERVSALGLGMASLGSGGGIVWEPNWIDYRSSVANVERRRDLGEVPSTCDACGCETDIGPAPHSPKCPTLARDEWTRDGMLEAVEVWAAAHDDAPPLASDWTKDTTAHPSARQVVVEFASWTGFLEEAGFSASTPRRRGRRLGPPTPLDGRELLDRMDAGEPLTDEPELEEASAVGKRAESGAAPLLVGEPERAAASSSPRLKWTREKVIAAIREVGEKVGRTPSGADMRACGFGGAYQVSNFTRLGVTWAELVVEAGYEPRVRGDNGKSSGREPSAETRDGAETAAADATVTGDEETPRGTSVPSRPDTDHGRARAWGPEDVLAAIRRWNAEYGHPPTSTEWMRRVDGYPTTTTVASRFGSWANAIEQAGFDRPTRGGVPLKPLATPPKRVRVRGTGLTYRSAEEAYIAAEEIEADGERVAEQARFDAKEAKAEQAIDQSRELAEKIRDAAHAFEARHSAAANGAAPMVEPEDEPIPDPHAKGMQQQPPEPLPERDADAKPHAKSMQERNDRLLVTPDAMAPFQRALARGLIAGMRAAADALEQELAA